jgi:hypothetical protein
MSKSSYVGSKVGVKKEKLAIIPSCKEEFSIQETKIQLKLGSPSSTTLLTNLFCSPVLVKVKYQPRLQTKID